MIIWLASYPKSGNTWLRSIIGALLFTNDGIFNFKLLKKIRQFPVHYQFEGLIRDPNDIHEIKKKWITAQNNLNLDKKIKFLKTHQGFYVVDNYPFTNRDNTLATIYIVRDPRNLITSISNHYNLGIEKSLDFISTPKALKGRFEKDGRTFKSIRTMLGNWSEHYKSWTMNKDKLLVIKYEDLVSNTSVELEKIIIFLKNFMKINTNNIKNKNILETTSFENLKRMEKNGEFNESVFTKSKNKVDFFHLGKENKWEDLVEKKISNEIEKRFHKEMKELNYL